MAYKDFSKLGDHPDYRELYDSALKAAREAPEGAVAVEVGVRAGGSALTIQHALKDAGRNQYLITIDPHGNKPYLTRDTTVLMDYNDDMYREFMRDMSAYVAQYRLNWAHFKLKSLDFAKFWDDIEFWMDGKVAKDFFFVHLDGDHTDWVVKAEIDYFMPRLHGILTVDDADQLHPEAVCGEYPYKVEYNRLWL